MLSVWTKRVSAALGAGAAHAAAGQVGRAAPEPASGEEGVSGVSAAAGQCTITGFLFKPVQVYTVHRSASRDTGSVTSLTCPVYRVVMLGAQGVGKSAICSQFLSSDHVNTYENVGERRILKPSISGSVIITLQRTLLRRTWACQWTEERVTWCS